MENYKITLKEDGTGIVKEVVVRKLSFPEAVHEAYSLKNKLGHSWKITNINKKEK